MDAELYTRWQRNLAPFRFQCIRTDGLWPVPKMQRCLTTIARFLEAANPESNLRVFDDWSMHDGCIFDSKDSSWDSLHASVASPKALVEATCLDDVVYRSYFPTDYKFLLRINVEETGTSYAEEPANQNGDFDLTAEDFVLDALVAALLPDDREALIRESSKEFFDRRACPEPST